MTDSKKCERVNMPNVAPGWGCCSCRVYNGSQRPACKNCGHVRCDAASRRSKESN